MNDHTATRVQTRYMEKYGRSVFTPTKVKDAIQLLEKQKSSLVQDKIATPSEAPKHVQKWDESLRPHHIVNERSVRSQTNIHENYKSVFAQYGDLSIRTGNEFTDQHNAWYLGTAFPYTLPSAVGGYDVPYKPLSLIHI